MTLWDSIVSRPEARHASRLKSYVTVRLLSLITRSRRFRRPEHMVLMEQQVLHGHILGRHPVASRLGKRLREQEKLSYSIRSSIRIPTSGNTAWISVQGDFSAGKGIRLADIVKEEISKLADSGITQYELNMAKKYSRRELSASKNRSICSENADWTTT